jgi:hypothetical protein
MDVIDEKGSSNINKAGGLKTQGEVFMNSKNGMRFWSFGAVILVVFLICVSCASNTMSFREVSQAEMNKSELLGTVQSTITKKTQKLFGLIPMINKSDLEAEAYGQLIEKATQEFRGSVDIKNIKLVLNQKELKLTHYLYHYIVTGDVIALNSSTSRAASGVEGGLARAAEQIMGKVTPRSKIAIVYVTASDREVAEYIANELEFIMVGQGFVLIDRSQLDQLRREQNFQMSGEVDDDTAVSIGKIVGANAIITGSVTGTGDLRRLRLRAINTQTAQVLAVASEKY